ncbi:MAG: lipopolysaccharide core heptose(I) kinase RfaP [Gammaproteobacteria bacterium]|nr:lipopolysaccharide core heptose(I) kinase RfaP [Gammaproteobacteria bacterium]
MNKKLWVDPDCRNRFTPNTIFEDMQTVEGEVYRTGKGRVTLRFTRNGDSFFLKRHTGIGWFEIFKDLLQGRLPIIGAMNEWRALERLQIMNISSLLPVAFGQRGMNPATQESFLVTRELTGTVSLEDLVKSWQERKDFIHIKRALIPQVARMARRIHACGMNHRDMYICHIHVSQRWLDNPVSYPELFIIDLHRAQIRQSVPQRWLVKDIASLHFSSMDAGLTRNDRLRFMRAYRSMKLGQTLEIDKEFWADVQHRAERLYAKRPELVQEKSH